MTDKELADRVVALGVGESDLDTGTRWYAIDVDSMPADPFVRDWRVAGALMEKVEWPSFHLGNGQVVIVPNTREIAMSVVEIGDSLPRAIIEACVHALEPK